MIGLYLDMISCWNLSWRMLDTVVLSAIIRCRAKVVDNDGIIPIHSQNNVTSTRTYIHKPTKTGTSPIPRIGLALRILYETTGSAVREESQI